jgi:hypothetical protein
MHNLNSYHLPSREFYLWRGDTPKAILFKVHADFVSSDVNFFYFRTTSPVMAVEWAFTRQPDDNFLVAHPIWVRDLGETTWSVEAADATLATPENP